jgi:uncharacterized membrane protein
MVLNLTNVGDLAGTFDLDVDVPAGWDYKLQANGQPVSSISLSPYVFNTAELTLLVMPDVAAAVGSHTVRVTAVPQGSQTGAVSASGTVQVLDQGVQVEIISGPSSLDPRQQGEWQIRLTNTGQSPDTFELQAAGILALAGQFSSDSVSLEPGEAQTVQLTANNLDFLLPKPYRVVVAAESQADDRIVDQAEATVSLTAYEAVQAAWHPVEQTVDGVLSASFTLVITNTGNLNTEFQITGSVTAGGKVSFGTLALEIPARGTAALPALVEVPQGGVYQVSATAQSGQAQDSAAATLTVIFASEPPKLYLPVIMRSN